MRFLNPDKLSVQYRRGVTPTDPIIPRRYTLTHSDVTADLLLTIGTCYAYDKITRMRDEVLGEWVEKEKQCFFRVYLHVDGKKGTTANRNYAFRRELPLALTAIRYGDRALFRANPQLNKVPIIVYFRSNSRKYKAVENWGCFADYEMS
jgi:hypothetical protein